MPAHPDLLTRVENLREKDSLPEARPAYNIEIVVKHILLLG
jgi:hypothetical protein